MLVVATVIIAIESEFLVGAVEPMTETLGLSKLFCRYNINSYNR